MEFRHGLFSVLVLFFGIPLRSDTFHLRVFVRILERSVKLDLCYVRVPDDYTDSAHANIRVENSRWV